MSNTPIIDSYPVTVGPTTQFVQIGGTGPFQIINTDLSATVWINDNQNVSSAHGTPLYPGTAMIWTGSQGTGKTYAALDTGDVGKTPVLVIGNQVTDWQPNPIAIATSILNSGVILIDEPVQLVNQPGGGGAFTSVNFDITHYQSVNIMYQPNGAACTLLVAWRENGTLISQDAYGWAAGDVNTLNTKLPCRGDTVQVQVANTGVSGLQMFASMRPINSFNMNSITSRVLAQGTNALLGANAGMTITPTGRYDGPAIVSVAAVQGAAPDGVEVYLGDLITSNPVLYAMPLAVTQTGGFIRTAFTASCVIPRNSWNLQLRNNSAAAHFVQGIVVAAPEGT